MRNPRFVLPLLAAAFLAAAIPASALGGPECVGVPATLEGTDGPDTLMGTPGPDVIVAGGGDDVVRALGGDDLVCAGAGADAVYGEDGADRLIGGDGDDTLFGEAGNDVLVDDGGSDRLDGGEGDDHLAGGAGADFPVGGPGADTLRGGDGEDTLDGGPGADDLAGGPGVDRLLQALAEDDVSDAGGRDALGDTRWYRSVTLEPLQGTQVVFPNQVSGYDQRHTGPIEVRADDGGLVLVEHLAPEEYLRGIAEMPYSWHPAALRAQAIAARTYLADILARPPRGVMAEFGFDICGTSLCQAYLGAGRADTAEDGDRWAAAVTDTAGQILLYEGHPALAVYHSTGGATTRSNQDVWGGTALPYLQAVEVPPQDAPYDTWSYTLALDQFLAVLAAAGITLPGPVTEVATVVTLPGGGPYRVRFATADGPVEIPAGQVQAALNTYGPSLYPELLPAFAPGGARYPQAVLSPTFTVATGGSAVVEVTGQGWGHQVGMPQYGAQAMALAGETTAAILSHFYTGLRPSPDPGFLPAEITVGLGWERAAVTLIAGRYILHAPEGAAARGDRAEFRLSASEDGWVIVGGW